MRILNEIPGYRLTGETDNAWIHLGWWHRAQYTSRSSALPGSGPAAKHEKKKRKRRTSAAQRELSNEVSDSQMSNVVHSVSNVSAKAERSLCAMRELMLLVHNPPPRADTFGFKEIYSPFVREPAVFGEVFAQGVEHIRELFPRAKFIFHTRRNLSRTAESDFWGRRGGLANRTADLQHLIFVAGEYARYVDRHPTHAFATTLEGLTDRQNTHELEALFRFLDVPLAARLRRVARSHVPLYDWVEERHTRRIERRAADGTLLGVTKKHFAYRGGPGSAARKA